ncbi:MAG: PEP-CTERM sorting domain-containing protein [Planctomycetota bacterium]
MNGSTMNDWRFDRLGVVCGLVAGLAAALAHSSATAQLNATQKTDIGFTALQNRLGGSMPLGIGLSATIVEVPLGTGEYRLNTSDPQLTGKTYQFPSGGNTGVSWHATTVGKYLFGTQSLAPRIGATGDGSTVANYEVSNWVNSGFLNANSSGLLPSVETRKLVSQSWVGSFGSSANDTLVLNRADYAVQRDGTIATYALNNGSDTTIPSLMASTYNGIVVGLSNGNHSRGTTTIDGSGREKPDIVVPTEYTSWATPTVSSSAGLLVQVANTTGGLGNGQRQQVVKSLLMAGATKAGPNLPGDWSWSHSTTQPLDSIYGAGQLNIEQAYDILVAGEFSPSGSSLAAATGWDFGTASSVTLQRYFFDVGSAGDLTASLNWQRTMSAVDTQPGPGVSYSFSGTLANLDLKLYSASSFTLGSLLASSASTIDNTELIWATGLSAGRYALEVSSNTNAIDYGVAWTVVVPEPGTWVLFAVAATGGFVVRSRRWSRAA